MYRVRSLGLLLALLPICLPAAYGWGWTGHRAIARIAENHLTDNAAAAIRDLLGQESLPDVSTWADEIRSREEWRYTAPWHYVNVPEGESYAESEKYPEGDIIVALRQSEATLRNRGAPRQRRIEALKFLVHFIGDLHQPMHAGLASDRGGNRIEVRWMSDPDPTNLHFVWDNHLIDAGDLEFDEWAKLLDHAATEQVREWQSTSYVDWMEESRQHRREAYEFPRNRPLGGDYLHKHLPVVRLRLLQAGIRLAGMLNSVFALP